MAKKEKIAFLMPKEQIQKLDEFLTVETSGQKMFILTRADFFRILLDDTFKKHGHVLDYLRNRRKKHKKEMFK